MTRTGDAVGAGFSIDPDSKPFNHLEFNNDPADFQFAILADNSGGARPGVVAAGLQKQYGPVEGVRTIEFGMRRPLDQK